MGVLDSKNRVIDTVVTSQGRENIASGRGLDVAYYSFTDLHVNYRSGSYDDAILSGTVGEIEDVAKNRFFFEAPASLPHDTIFFTSNDSGHIDKVGPDYLVSDGVISVLTGSQFWTNESSILTGSYFSSLSNNLLKSTPDNFNRLCLIKKDLNVKIYQTEIKTETELKTNLIEDVMLTTSSIDGYKNIKISAVPSLNKDPKMFGETAFMYLPPIISTQSGLPELNFNTTGSYEDRFLNLKNLPSPQGKYPYNFNIKPDWKAVESSGSMGAHISYVGTKKLRLNGNFYTVKLTNVIDPKIVFQIFESNISSARLSKLDIFDAGDMYDKENSETKRVFFAGKIVVYNNSPKFLPIMTLVFRRNEDGS